MEDLQDVFVPHSYKEQVVDLGEVRMNYVVAGSSDKTALLLIPGQTESWWGFEKAISLLESRFQVFAVDLRGQLRALVPISQIVYGTDYPFANEDRVRMAESFFAALPFTPEERAMVRHANAWRLFKGFAARA